MPTAVRQPMPDILGRLDKTNGQWEIRNVPMEPGKARTYVVGHQMDVPVGDTAQERLVRAHEMMHAKASPAEEWQAWIDRGMATPQALEVAEEFRVNTLVARAGFDIKALTDGSEKATGERIGLNEDWAQGVYMTAAFAGTGRLAPFIAGVRKHNPEWAKSYKALASRLAFMAKKIETFMLGATRIDKQSGLAPYGFVYAEAWAMMLDQIANPPKSDEDEDAENSPEGEANAVVLGEDGEGIRGGVGEGGKKVPTKPRVNADEIKKMKPMKKIGGWWDDLRVERCPMPRVSPGGMGRKKRAADRGRYPRRIHRMLVDPQRRVFDAKKRGNGGVVLIDGSGSMHFTQSDIIKLVEAAPGATVAVYSSRGNKETPNLFIVADKGRMAAVAPERETGNGVDRPAIEWAITQKQHAAAPVVWITDGAVHGPGQGYYDQMALDCLRTVLQNKVVMAPDVTRGVDALRLLSSGQKPKRWMPIYWKHSWKDVMGTDLKY